jgi:hydroxyethylthiazole kinase
MHALAATASDLPEAVADMISRLRSKAPRVHCITNSVAQSFTANTLLAAGAIPSMSIAPDEIAEFVARADALLVNLGTLDRERRDAVESAVNQAMNERLPWVLDPVFVDRSRSRATLAKSLMAKAPRAVRLNAGEFAAIADAEPAEASLHRYALDRRCVVALTGPSDTVTDGTRITTIDNGDPLMSRVTAMGCAGTALVAACLAVEADPWRATAGALLAFAIAGEQAAARARGPGSLAVEILDALACLDRETLLARAKVR